MSRLPILVLLAALLASALVACGNKGPLVRPPPEPAEDVADDADFDEAAEQDGVVDDEPDAPPPDPGDG